MDKEQAPRSGSDIPSELTRQRLREWAMTLSAKKVGGGALLCGVASLVLFRSPLLRVGLTALGAGWGGGVAYKTVTDEVAKR